MSDPLQQARFWRKYLRLTRSGVPVLRALEVIEAEADDEQICRLVSTLRRGIEDGATLSAAMDQSSYAFSPSVRELICTAERRGAWDEILEELAAGLEEGTFD